MQYTGNYNLKKPEGTDVVNINDLNDNADILDKEVSKKANKKDLDALNQDLDAHKADIVQQLSTKVDKVQGKGLSDENYTLAEKDKLAGIKSGAEKNKVNSVNGKTGAVSLNATDVGAETPAGAQEKADAAESSAKAYTDQEVANVENDLATHKAEDASTTAKGHVQLNNTVTSTSTTQAATANAVKTAYDKGNHSHPYAPSTHTHDNRYYTESEMNTKLAAKVDKPSSATSGNIAVFDGGAGKLKDGGASIATLITASIVVGTYTGNGKSSRTILLGFKPRAVLLMSEYGETHDYDSYYERRWEHEHCGGLAVNVNGTDYNVVGVRQSGYDVKPDVLKLTSNGFMVYNQKQIDGNYRTYVYTNADGRRYMYIALK